MTTKTTFNDPNSNMVVGTLTVTKKLDVGESINASTVTADNVSAGAWGESDKIKYVSPSENSTYNTIQSAINSCDSPSVNNQYTVYVIPSDTAYNEVITIPTGVHVIGYVDGKSGRVDLISTTADEPAVTMAHFGASIHNMNISVTDSDTVVYITDLESRVGANIYLNRNVIENCYIKNSSTKTDIYGVVVYTGEAHNSDSIYVEFHNCIIWTDLATASNDNYAVYAYLDNTYANNGFYLVFRNCDIAGGSGGGLNYGIYISIPSNHAYYANSIELYDCDVYSDSNGAALCLTHWSAGAGVPNYQKLIIDNSSLLGYFDSDALYIDTGISFNASPYLSIKNSSYLTAVGTGNYEINFKGAYTSDLNVTGDCQIVWSNCSGIDNDVYFADSGCRFGLGSQPPLATTVPDGYTYLDTSKKVVGFNIDGTYSTPYKVGHVATRFFTLTGLPIADETVVIGGTTYTFGAPAPKLPIGGTADACLVTLANAINTACAVTVLATPVGGGSGVMMLQYASAVGGTPKNGTATAALAHTITAMGTTWDAADLNVSGRVAAATEEFGRVTIDAVNSLAPFTIALSFTPDEIEFSAYTLAAAVRTPKYITATVEIGADILVVDPTAGATPLANGDILIWRAWKNL